MKTVLCFGDSNTHGQIPGKDGGRYEKEIRWPGVLKSMLGDSFDVIEEGLGGRTTVFEDPIEEDKSGKAYLQQCLHSHKPIDLIIVMLGTNDLKIRFGLTAYDVSLGFGNPGEKDAGRGVWCRWPGSANPYHRSGSHAGSASECGSDGKRRSGEIPCCWRGIISRLLRRWEHGSWMLGNLWRSARSTAFIIRRRPTIIWLGPLRKR